MIIALAGYKTQNIGEIPEILYVGDSGVKLAEVAAKQGDKGFVRLRRFQLDSGIPIALPVSKPVTIVRADDADKQSAPEGDDQAKKDAEKAARKAEAKAKKDAEKAAKTQTT
jgi:hypothetical protein